jgi:hypothetical protein
MKQKIVLRIGQEFYLIKGELTHCYDISTQGKKMATQMFLFSFQAGRLMNLVWSKHCSEIPWRLNEENQVCMEAVFLLKQIITAFSYLLIAKIVTMHNGLHRYVPLVETIEKHVWILLCCSSHHVWTMDSLYFSCSQTGAAALQNSIRPATEQTTAVSLGKMSIWW